MSKKLKDQYNKYQEIIHYLIVGVCTTVVSLTTYYGLVLTVLNPNNGFQLQIANIISWLAAVLFSYITNRKFVFKSKNKNIIKEISDFFLSRIVTLLMDMAIMFLFVTVLHGNDKIAKLIVQVIVTISNYIFSKLFVFKKDLSKSSADAEYIL